MPKIFNEVVQFLNPYLCPKCKERFPFFISPTMQRHNDLRSLFLAPNLECSNCGQICRSKMYWKNAIWAWPLGILFSLYFGVLLSWSTFLKSNILLEVLILFVYFFCVFAIIRKGCILKPVHDTTIIVKNEAGRLLILFLLILFVSSFAYYSPDWPEALYEIVAISILFIGILFLYCFESRKKSIGN